MTPKKFCPDRCFADALKFTNRRSFFEGAPASYESLRKRKLLDQACAHMQISPLYSYARWTDETALAEAAKYKNRAEFRRSNQGAYGYALKNDLLASAFANAKSGHNFWHLFELMAVALKYTEKTTFISSEPQAYNFANKNKLVDIACAHMTTARIDWDRSSVLIEALKHQSRGMLRVLASGAYKHADKHGYLDEACAHMDVTRRAMTQEMAIDLAKQYETRSKFQECDGGAYSYARLSGCLDQACAHMVPGINGFSKEKSAVLYHLRISLADGTTLYKIGITNRKPETRVAGMGIQAGASVEIIDVTNFESGRDARIAEKRLHRRMAEFRYRGPAIMKNGNTELFTVGALN